MELGGNNMGIFPYDPSFIMKKTILALALLVLPVMLSVTSCEDEIFLESKELRANPSKFQNGTEVELRLRIRHSSVSINGEKHAEKVVYYVDDNYVAESTDAQNDYTTHVVLTGYTPGPHKLTAKSSVDVGNSVDADNSGSFVLVGVSVSQIYGPVTIHVTE